MMKRSDYINFLNDHKAHVGMPDWKVIIKYEKVDKDCDAEVTADAYEKALEVSLYNGFFKADDGRKFNVLFHELLHARFLLYQHQCEKITDEVEEQFINDVVRGFESVSKQFGVNKLQVQ